MGRFEIRDNFYLDGEPFRIISGSIHYCRVPPEYWYDRLLKLRAMGANTVETYVFWNVHQPRRGEFCFEGAGDIARFLRLAQEAGLYAIVRPSPYVCSEWEFGGMPAWLMDGQEDIPVRTTDSRFMACVEEYYSRLLPILAPLQLDQGGNILMFQVENEYGYYAADPAYVDALADLMRRGGLTQPFCTSDGGYADALARGSRPGYLPTVNLGSRAAKKLEVLRSFRPNAPLMIMELWSGWFDSWGGEHHAQNTVQTARNVRDALKAGSFNLYMFHGGTSFGFMNGSTWESRLLPDVTSYDYGAPLAEDGHPTRSYFALQSLLERLFPGSTGPLPDPIPTKAYGILEAVGRTGLFENLDNLSEPRRLPRCLPMERLGQSVGYILYETLVTRRTSGRVLAVENAADRVQIFVNHRHVLTVMGEELAGGVTLPRKLSSKDRLSLLVENMGRVNFGPRLTQQRKGINGPVTLDGVELKGWDCRPLPMEGLDRLDLSLPYEEGTPTFTAFELDTDTPADTFMECPGFGKGAVFVNGRCLGRFWSIGPQRRLYLPAPWLKPGKNQILIYESEGAVGNNLIFRSKPEI